MRKLGLVLGAGGLLIVVLLALWIFSRPERGTSSVSTSSGSSGRTTRSWSTADDPKVEGVAYISRAQTGGEGRVGVAGLSDAASRRQVGATRSTANLGMEHVFDERASS
jgi:catabolite regulation protein CreA